MKDTHKGEFGRFLATARRRSNLTQNELAQQVYVTESAVSKWERGLSYPDIATLAALARTLNVTEGELVAASEDRQGRLNARDARSHRRWRAAVLWSTTGLYGLALTTCFIVNLAVNHRLSWFWIVVCAIAIPFCVTTLPLIVKRRRGWTVVAASVISLCALLAVTDLTSGGGFLLPATASVLFAALLIWSPFLVRTFGGRHLRRHTAAAAMAIDALSLIGFLAVILLPAGHGEAYLFIALPIAAFCISLAALFLLILRYLPVRRLLRAAIATAVFALAEPLIFPVINALGSRRQVEFSRFDLSVWNSCTIQGNVTALIVGAAAIASIVLFALAVVLRRGSRSVTDRTISLP
ncbi:MAG: helix-turn-helix transcriptional regulator [Microbacterium enclense]